PSCSGPTAGHSTWRSSGETHDSPAGPLLRHAWPIALALRRERGLASARGRAVRKPCRVHVAAQNREGVDMPLVRVEIFERRLNPELEEKLIERMTDALL